jgi:PKHD-type hydroxylase
MTIALTGVLAPAEVGAIRDAVGKLEFGDGRATAGRRAREVKANDQALPSPARDAILEKVRRALMAHPVFLAAARPQKLTPLLLSRYRAGQTYGLHVDDAIMGGLRTDLSFTLFLSDLADYEGGALEIEDDYAPREVRLNAGDVILYPSTTLHRVTPVTRGERLAVVGWVQSWIRLEPQREVLFDLDQAIASLEQSGAARPALDRLHKARSNLLRLWAGG